MRDFYKGEGAVKVAGTRYLPPTSGMVLDGMNTTDIGFKNYQAYKARAVFPDYVKDGVEALIGLIHQHAPKIQIPERMNYLLEKATVDGEPLLMLLRKINEEQLVPGRVGLLVDLPLNPDPANPQPFITMYSAESLRNWDSGEAVQGINELSMAVLDESCNVREQFDWTWKERYRVLQLINGLYVQALFEGDTYVEADMKPCMLRGKTLDKIPFVIINSKDLIAEPDVPPLLGLGRACLSIYRTEADYRQNLHMQGQDTLVTVGGLRQNALVEGVAEDSVRVGAGSRIDVEMGGDAKFIGVSSTGLSEQRNCLENDRKRAESKAGQLVGNQSIKNESGSAMLARLAAQTASLMQISLTAAEGLQSALRYIAEWMGEDPSKVKVEANTEFTAAANNAQELVYLMTARNLGAPISMESIHANMKELGYTQMEFADEITLFQRQQNEYKKATQPEPKPTETNPKAATSQQG